MTSYKPQEKYDAENTKRFTLKVNLKTERDILDKLLSVKSKQGYIKSLIRADMNEGLRPDFIEKLPILTSGPRRVDIAKDKQEV